MIQVITEREEAFRDIGWQNFIDVDSALLELNFSEYISVDTETTGFSFKEHEMFSMQLGIDGKGFVIDLETIPIKLFKKVLQTKHLLFQNAAFDLPFLYDKGIVPTDIWDTLLAEQVLTLGLLSVKRGLGALVEKYCGIKIDKSKQKEIHKTGILDYEAIEYAGKDVLYLKEIKDGQIKQATEDGNIRAIKLENSFVRVNAYLEFCGIYFDAECWMSVAREMEYLEYRSWLRLNQYVKNKLGIDAEEEEINWGSTEQVKPILLKLGVDIYDEKTKKETLNQNFLKKQQDKHEIIKLYLDYKRYQKAVSTYGRNWFDYPFPSKRIHTQFKQLVSTGRMSCGNVKKGPFPNIQNLPKSKKVRSSFKGQRNNVLITCDYSGQESVLLADRSEEPALLEFYRNGGGDLHSFVAKQIWKDELHGLSLAEVKEKHGDKRQLAKGANFAITYGGNGYTIANNLNLSRELGDSVYNSFMKSFPGLNKYFSDTFNACLRDGHILINELTGLKRYVLGLDEYKQTNEEDRKFEGMLYRKALNTPIQATAAQITKTAAIYFFDWIMGEGLFGKVKIVNMVHDEIVVEDNPKRVERTAEALQNAMEKAGRVFLKNLRLKAVPEIDKVWKK